MKITIMGEGSVSDGIRAFQCQKYFKDHDIDLTELPPGGGEIKYRKVDLLIASRPLDSDILAHYKRNGSIIWVDQDDDFEEIPPEHPGYKAIGRGAPTILGRHKICLKMADVLTVSTPYLAKKLRSDAIVIPNGWNSEDPMWKVRPKKNGILWVGWAGTITHRDDFKVAIPAFVRAYSLGCGIVIGGDPHIWYMLQTELEKTDRKLDLERLKFIPGLPYRLYPFVVRSMDILTAPLVNNSFNLAKSDIKLVDAGAACIPFVASNVPAYQNWGVGGILARTPDEWIGAIETLIENEDMRDMLAATGAAHVEHRKFHNLSHAWREVLENTVRSIR